MTDYVAFGFGAAIASFAIGRALEATGRRRRLHRELTGAPATPPSLYPKINSDACICTGACVDACPESDVLAIVGGRPRLVRAGACVGHADCLRSCPVSAIELVLGSPERAVEVPVISGAFETTVAGLYVAGEITGVGLIHNALAQGRQAARAALDGAGEHDCDYDLVVIGAGPAGLGAALEAKARGARAIVFEKATIGGAIASYPRAKVVMSAPFELPGLGKRKLRRTTKEALLELFEDVIARAELAIVERAEVTQIRERTIDGFTVDTKAGQVTAQRVVLAIGRRGTPRTLGVAGDDLPHVVFGVDDPAAFAGRDVAVVGGGDSAVEIALALAAQPGTAVTLVHRGTDFGRCKPDNQAAIEAARDAGQLAVALDAKIGRVEPEHVELVSAGERVALPASLVVCCLGAELPSQWLRGIGIELRELRGEPLQP
jgi:thioredoxin reductase/Pyruvate/2-oxoacid:ferredoxin oxidoreductase delta subunit